MTNIVTQSKHAAHVPLLYSRTRAVKTFFRWFTPAPSIAKPRRKVLVDLLWTLEPRMAKIARDKIYPPKMRFFTRQFSMINYSFFFPYLRKIPLVPQIIKSRILSFRPTPYSAMASHPVHYQEIAHDLHFPFSGFSDSDPILILRL